MKFYNSIGPNPHVVKMFAAEKGIELPKHEVDLLAGENRKPEYRKINPHGTTPALETQEGFVLAEITAICEYLEELHPTPALIGTTPMQRAQTRMWVRRIDLGVCEPMANGFRFGEGLGMFKDRVRCIPAASGDLKAIAQTTITWIDGLMGPWIVGERLTLADILLYCFLSFGETVGQAVNPDNRNIVSWYARMKALPSAIATA